MVVEELLQLLVGEVDAQLLEAVELLDRVAAAGPMRTGGLSEEQRKKNRGEQPSLVLPDGARGERSTDDFDP